MLEHILDKSTCFLLLLDALHISLSARLLIFAAKYSAYGTEHAYTGVFTHTAHRKYLCSCGHIWVMRQHGVGNLLAVFAPHLLEEQLIFTFTASETGYLASLTLEPSFFSSVPTL